MSAENPRTVPGRKPLRDRGACWVPQLPPLTWALPWSFPASSEPLESSQAAKLSWRGWRGLLELPVGGRPWWLWLVVCGVLLWVCWPGPLATRRTVGLGSWDTSLPAFVLAIVSGPSSLSPGPLRFRHMSSEVTPAEWGVLGGSQAASLEDQVAVLVSE